MDPVSLSGLTLHVADVERSLAFYTKLPGVEVIVHRPGQIAIVRIGQGRLGLLKRSTDRFHLEIDAADLDATYEGLRRAGIEPEGPPVQRPWGDRDFRVRDPDGNWVEFEAPSEPPRP